MAAASRRISLLVLLLAAVQTGCTYYKPIEPEDPFNPYKNAVIIRNGERAIEGPLDIKSRNQIPILGKVNIGFSWLSGPIEIKPCRMGVQNIDPNKNRFLELNGKLTWEYISEAPGPRFGKRYITGTDNFVYGTDSRDGRFQGYSGLCGHVFLDIWAGVSVHFIKPDFEHGSGKWIANAEPTKINGQTWLLQRFPLKSGLEGGKLGTGVVERWVLKVPQTDYWFVVIVSGSTEDRPGLPGVNRNPAKFARVLELVHQMVESVTIEPIDSNGNPRTPPTPSSPAFQRLNGWVRDDLFMGTPISKPEGFNLAYSF